MDADGTQQTMAAVNKAVAQVAAQRGFSKPSFDVKPGSKAGDGYSGLMYRVTIQEAPSSSCLCLGKGKQRDDLVVMCKLPMPQSGNVMMTATADTEGVIYTKILTAIEEIAGFAAPYPWPRCLYLAPVDSACLVLSDLKPEGFVTANRRVAADEAHCRLALRRLAQFHGGSMALLAKRPAETRAVLDALANPFASPEMQQMFQQFPLMIGRSLAMIEDRFPAGSEAHGKLHAMLGLMAGDGMQALAAPPPAQPGVALLHGDCHLNNFMFKYDEVGGVVDCQLIDFQLCRMGNTAMDVVSLLLPCTEKATRDAHWDALLRGYHDELQAVLRRAGCDPDAVYSWADFQAMSGSAAAMLCGAALLLLAASASAANDDPNDPAYDMTFPDGFIFSAASASYQVEGGWNASGKGVNIWDYTTHEHPELILDRSNGDVACDSYHKYKEDIRMAKELGTGMYRFSLSWSRLLPTGAIDVVNEDGVRYYNALIDECLGNGIKPMITLFHWDLPQSLQDLGGFANKVLVDYFVDYADFAFKTFGPKVKWWLTINEPLTVCADGYGSGIKAPVIKADGRADYLCAHTLLKAHAKAYRLYQREYKAQQQGQVGIAPNSDFYWPKDPANDDDVAAAQRWQQFNLGWFTHPVFSAEGDYPAVLKQRVLAASKAQGLKRSRLPAFTPEEVEEIRGSADFMGINSYTSTVVASLKAGGPQPTVGTRAGDAAIVTSVDPSWETTVTTWHRVVPEGLRKLLNWIKDAYGNPRVIITENGYPDLGELKDEKRTRYYRLYILELLKAINLDKCNVFGYTAWSLMDNYEWFDGYVHRFGLYSVDFNDPERPRTAKLSALFYKRLIAKGKVPRDGEVVWPAGSTR